MCCWPICSADRGDNDQAVIELLETGIAKLAASNARRIRPSPQMYSYLSVAQARDGRLDDAIDTNRTILERQPNNVAALRNLAILYRDQGDRRRCRNLRTRKGWTPSIRPGRW